jgi:hypothetical protein
MKITAVCCQGCGASLKIEDLTRYVTCSYCRTRLEVVHDDDIVHTRPHEQLEESTRELLGEVKELRLDNDLKQLDRAWERYRQVVLKRDENDKFIEPSDLGSLATGIICGIVGLILSVIALFNLDQSPLLLLIGLAILGAAFYNLTQGRSVAREYAARRSDYESERGRLRSELDLARRSRAS